MLFRSTADPGGNRSAVTANADTTSSFSADGNGGSTIFIKIGLTTASTSGGTWTAASDSQYTLNTIPSVGTFTQQDGTAVAVNDTFNAANANGATGVASVPVFKYVIASSTTAQTVTFKFTGSGVSGGSTVSRTITINIVNAATSVASSGLTWSGTSNIEELVDGSGTSTTLDAASTGSIGAADYVATVSILGGAGKTSNEVNAKYRISFLAPDGFAYNVSGTSWDNYDQATLSQTAGDTWTASVPTSVTLKTTAAKAFAAYNFTARLIDKDNGSTERTAGDSIYMVRNGATLWAAKIDNVKYTNTSGTTTATQLAVNGNNEVLFANPTTFTGRVLTWADIANSTTTGPASLTGTWYLIAGPAPSSGAYGFGASSLGTMTANYDASTVGVAAYAQPTITINMASKYFTPNYGANKSNQDTITLKFADTPNSFNVESNGGVTLTSTP